MPAEYVNRHNIVGEAIADMYTSHAKRYTGSLGRISDARELLIGEMKRAAPGRCAEARRRRSVPRRHGPEVHERDATGEHAGGSGPSRAGLKRPKLATSDLGERNSSRIERFINPAVKRGLSQPRSDRTGARRGRRVRACCPRGGPVAEGAGRLLRARTARRSARSSSARKGDGKALRRPDRRARRLRRREVQGRVQARREAVTLRPMTATSRTCAPATSRATSSCSAGSSTSRSTRGSRALMLRSTASSSRPGWRHRMRCGGTTSSLACTSTWSRPTRLKATWTRVSCGTSRPWLTDQDADGNLYPYVAHSLAGKATENDRVGFEDKAVIDLRKQCGLTRCRSCRSTAGAGSRSTRTSAPCPTRSRSGARGWRADAFLTGKAYAGWSEGMLAWFMQMPDTCATRPCSKPGWSSCRPTRW
jgi:hypothetical protein